MSYISLRANIGISKGADNTGHMHCISCLLNAEHSIKKSQHLDCQDVGHIHMLLCFAYLIIAKGLTLTQTMRLSQQRLTSIPILNWDDSMMLKDLYNLFEKPPSDLGAVFKRE